MLKQIPKFKLVLVQNECVKNWTQSQMLNREKNYITQAEITCEYI